MNETNLPQGYRILDEDQDLFNVEFLIGAHFGDLGEINVPKPLWSKFCSDSSWREIVMGKCSKVIYLGTFKGQMETPE
ncbi:MAG: hypothetical protein V7784_22070 [Oceanospirillaceae bacterium]